MKITASGNFKNAKWSGVKNHVKHDPKQKHENEYLNTEESKNKNKYNTLDKINDYDELVNQRFGSFVKEHDKRMKDKSRRFGSVKRFLNVDDYGRKRSNPPEYLYMQKLGDEKSYNEYLKKLTDVIIKKGKAPEQAKDLAFKITNIALLNHIQGFDKRNPNLRLCEFATHLDEIGAGHYHSRILPITERKKTKKGNLAKPKWTINAALKEQYNGKGTNKTRLARFRKQEDMALIDCVNEAVEKYTGEKGFLKFYRKTDENPELLTGLDHEAYKQLQDQIKSLEKDIDTKKEALSDFEIQRKIFTSDKEKAQDEKKTAENARDKALNDKRQAEQQNQILEQRNLELLQRENDLKDREKKVKEKEKEQAERQKSLDKKEKNINLTIAQEVKEQVNKWREKLLDTFKKPLRAFYKAYDKKLNYSNTNANSIRNDLLTDFGQKQAHQGIKAGLTELGKSMIDYKDLKNAIDFDDSLQKVNDDKEKQKLANIPKKTKETPKKDITDDIF